MIELNITMEIDKLSKYSRNFYSFFPEHNNILILLFSFPEKQKCAFWQTRSSKWIVLASAVFVVFFKVLRLQTTLNQYRTKQQCKKAAAQISITITNNCQLHNYSD